VHKLPMSDGPARDVLSARQRPPPSTGRSKTWQLRSEVSVHVHPLMQDPYYVDGAVGAEAVVEGVRCCGELAVAWANLVAAAANPRVRRGTFDCVLKSAQVLLGLVDVPPLRCVVPNFFEVGLSGG